jgi:hypothetical protein
MVLPYRRWCLFRPDVVEILDRCDGIALRSSPCQMRKDIGGLARNRTGVQGFAVLCVTTPPRGRPGCGVWRDLLTERFSTGKRCCRVHLRFSGRREKRTAIRRRKRRTAPISCASTSMPKGNIQNPTTGKKPKMPPVTRALPRTTRPVRLFGMPISRPNTLIVRLGASLTGFSPVDRSLITCFPQVPENPKRAGYTNGLEIGSTGKSSLLKKFHSRLGKSERPLI